MSDISQSFDVTPAAIAGVIDLAGENVADQLTEAQRDHEGA